MKAIWKDRIEAAPRPALQGEAEADVAVIGAGITGLSAAYELATAGLKVLVLEARRVGDGTTGGSTGNLYATIDEGLHSLEEKHGAQSMQAVASARHWAMELLEARVADLKLDCGLRRVPFHLFATDSNAGARFIERERAAWERAGLRAGEDMPADAPWKAQAALVLDGQAQLDPLRYLLGLAQAAHKRGAVIHEDSRVLKLEEGEPCVLETRNGRVKADRVVNATHSPVGRYAVHTTMLPRREFAVAAPLSGKGLADGIYWHQGDKSHYSIRPCRHDGRDYLLALGQSHELAHQRAGDLEKLEDYLREHFGAGEISHRWAEQNYRPADNLPYIGTSPLQDKVYIATGFAADGLVWGTLAARLISDAIRGKQIEWADLFKPTRFTPAASAAKTLEEGRAVTRHLLHDYLHYGQVEGLDEIRPGEGKLLKLEGERVAASRDGDGGLHVVSAVCSHMGCIVHWNGLEQSWDCPCHGSRFDIHGEVLEGPAPHALARPREAGSNRE